MGISTYGFHNWGTATQLAPIVNRISINFYPFDTRENWNLRCLVAYMLASVVAFFVSLRFRVPTFCPKTEGDGPPDAVFVHSRPDVSVWEVSFSHDPIGSTWGANDGLIAGCFLGYAWEVFYALRSPRLVS